jgi:uncharacterized protein
LSTEFKATRREFLETGTGIAAAATLFAQTSGTGVPHRALGKTGVQVSALGVGSFHLGSAKDVNEARQIVDLALDAGINFFDSAWEYHDGAQRGMVGRGA